MPSSCPEPCEAGIRAGHGRGDRCCVIRLYHFFVVLVDECLSGLGPAALHLESRTWKISDLSSRVAAASRLDKASKAATSKARGSTSHHARPDLPQKSEFHPRLLYPYISTIQHSCRSSKPAHACLDRPRSIQELTRARPSAIIRKESYRRDDHWNSSGKVGFTRSIQACLQHLR